MALNKSRLSINIINRRCGLVLSANNLADMRGSGSDKKSSDSEKAGMAKAKNPFGLFISYASPSDCNPSTPTMYECRKYGHRLPINNVAPNFELLPKIPSGIFRCTVGEQLGTGAGKCCYYKCPEYFSYHHMTFYDMHLILRDCRRPSPKTGRKP